MTTDTNSILTKIKKLQNLTVERGASPEEAANAAAKAQALLFAHNLSQADVETADPSAKPDPYGKVEHTLHGANRNTVQWRRTLLYVIAKHNWCTAVTLPGTTKMHVVGKRSNVETVLYLNDAVAGQIHRMAVEASKPVLQGKAKYQTEFCYGAVDTIHRRLREQRRQDEATATTMSGTMDSGRAAKNALVLRSAEQELQKAIAHFYPHLRTTTSRRSIGSLDGYRAGQAAGQSIGLHRGLGSNPSRLLH